MRRALAAVVFAAVLATGCAHAPATVVTPQGKAAYAADQVVLRVNELQAAVIQAEATGGLPRPVARNIVTWTVRADGILKDMAIGWQTALVNSWGLLKAQIPAAQLRNPLIALAVAEVDALLAAIGGSYAH